MTGRRVVTICNQRGLHARAAAQFVKLAGHYRADMWVEKDGMRVSAESIMGLMMLGAARGSEIAIEGDGDDAMLALAALCRLVEQGFHEDE